MPLAALQQRAFIFPTQKLDTGPWKLYWLVGGIFAWLVAPVVLIIITIPSPLDILSGLPVAKIALPYVFGLLWGIGGLTFGLTMRYLGVGLGMAISLGLTAVFGTLIPPLMKGQMQQLISSSDGQVTLLGILAGIVVCHCWVGRCR